MVPKQTRCLEISNTQNINWHFLCKDYCTLASQIINNSSSLNRENHDHEYVCIADLNWHMDFHNFVFHFLLSLSFDWGHKQTLKTLSSAEYYVFSILLLVSGNVMTNCQWCLIHHNITNDSRNPGFRVDDVSLFWFVLGNKNVIVL